LPPLPPIRSQLAANPSKAPCDETPLRRFLPLRAQKTKTVSAPHNYIFFIHTSRHFAADCRGILKFICLKHFSKNCSHWSKPFSSILAPLSGERTDAKRQERGYSHGHTIYLNCSKVIFPRLAFKRAAHRATPGLSELGLHWIPV